MDVNNYKIGEISAGGFLPVDVPYTNDTGTPTLNWSPIMNKLIVANELIDSILIRIALNDISATAISFKITSDFEIKTIIDDVSANSYPNTEDGIKDFIYFRRRRELKEF